MVDRVTKYALDVVNNKIITGKLVKLACQRHLNDLEKQGTEDFPYFFSEEKANIIINFAETLQIDEGDNENRGQLKLEGFQDFILGSLFGWVNKKGYRRFRTNYTQLGRQNGKSFINGILGVYCGNFDGYKYPQLYCTATKHDQAKIVYGEMVKFIRADKDLDELFKIKEYKSEIECLITGGSIKALGRDTKSIDGFRPYLGIVDEYHKHTTNQMYKLLEGGTRNLKQCLISIITTAGDNLNSPCKIFYDYCVNVLNCICDDDKLFIYIAQMDEDDDYWDSENWIKANPLIATTKIGIENIKDTAIKARQIGGSDLADFCTKALNMWYEYCDNQYINLENLKKCGSDMTLEDMRGKECVVGIDLSSGGDLTSIALEFKLENNKYFIHSHSFIPLRRVDEHIKTDLAPYNVWINNKLLTVTETLGGVKTDYKYIISELNRLISDYDLKIEAIAYDPHNADAFLSDLEEFGVDCIEIKQSCKSLNDATVDFKLEVDAGNIIYDRKNKLLTWSFANAKTVSNSFKEIKIDKDLGSRRIDPCDAVINAHKIVFKQESKVDYSKYRTEDYIRKFYGGGEN